MFGRQLSADPGPFGHNRRIIAPAINPERPAVDRRFMPIGNPTGVAT
jgi:hypothetical protein